MRQIRGSFVIGGEHSCLLSVFLKCTKMLPASFKDCFEEGFSDLLKLFIIKDLFISRTFSFPNSGPFGTFMSIQMPEFSFFPANRERPYADS